MRLLQKIERLQKKQAALADGRPKECRHLYTLKMFGEIKNDPPPCACGGERITISVVHATNKTIAQT